MLINNESVERDGDNMNEPIIQVEGICKSFSTVKVLENISFSIRPGQVLALIGENGAGKSTLCKIIAGSYTPDQGRIRIGDKWYPNLTIEEAKKLGIKTGSPGAADPSQTKHYGKYLCGQRTG